jgi:ABC-type uncharacterized transport system substrate-binding protein
MDTLFHEPFFQSITQNPVKSWKNTAQKTEIEKEHLQFVGLDLRIVFYAPKKKQKRAAKAKWKVDHKFD